MAAREENILNVPISETLEGMHVLCDTGDTGEPYRVAASLFIAEATQAAKDAVSNLDPKDVILKGFTALTAGKPAITANTTLLAAIQSLYAMVGSGKVKIVSDGADQTGMVCWNGTSASGFVINVNEAAIYTRSQWTQSNPDSVTDANWIAAVKTGGVKNPFNALNTLLTGWVNRSTQKPTITSANTIFDALKALYWASGNGNVLNVSNGGNRFGFVGWNANTAYGFMVDTANLTIYIRQWAQAQATSNANTTALWREAIQGGDAYSLKHPLNVYNYSGSGNIPSGDLAKVGAAEVFVHEIGGQRAPLFKVTGDDTMVQFSSAPIVENGDPSSGEPLENHYMSVVVNLSTGAVTADIVPIFSPEWLDKGGKPIHVVDFTMVNEIWPVGQFPGATVPFYATGEMYSPPPGNDTAYVGQITLNADFAQSGMATVIAYGNKTGRLYHAQLDFAGQGIDWSPSPSGTISVNDFKAVVGSAVFQNMRDGEVVGFFSSSGGGASGPGVNPALGYIQKASASQANILAYNMGATKAWIGYATSAATKWTELGGGGNVIHGEDIIEGLEYLIPDNVGDVVAFRSTMDSAQAPAEQEGFGFLAKVNGSESMAMMMQNDPAGGGKMKFFMGRVQNDGYGTDWQELTTGSSSEIFPGWKRIVSAWSIAVGPTGTNGIMNFNQEIPLTSKMLVEATIQSSPVATATIKFPVPLTIAGINETRQGVLFEICSRYLGKNNTPGSIKLICSSVITGAYGVQGMNIVVQSDNLSDASDIILIEGIYFKA